MGCVVVVKPLPVTTTTDPPDVLPKGIGVSKE